MTTETDKDKKPETKELTFKCKFCGESRPLSEMVTLPGFFPPIVACRACERKMR